MICFLSHGMTDPTNSTSSNQQSVSPGVRQPYYTRDSRKAAALRSHSSLRPIGRRPARTLIMGCTPLKPRLHRSTQRRLYIPASLGQVRRYLAI